MSKISNHKICLISYVDDVRPHDLVAGRISYHIKYESINKRHNNTDED